MSAAAPDRRLRPRVLKFGGTSVGSAASLAKALEIAEAAGRERPLVVVVSALSGVTDALLAALAGAAAGRLAVDGFVRSLRERHFALLQAVARGTPAARAAAVVEERVQELQRRLREVAAARSFSPPARAALLALGERLSAPVFAAGLLSRGLAAAALDAAELVRTDDDYDEADIDLETTRQRTLTALATLPGGTVAVVTGFIGATRAGATTLLGRGASDLTAAVLGWAIRADRVEIWSDVDGVLSADPRRVPGARTLPYLTYAEATALARAGAKVLHPRTLPPLESACIPVFVGNTLRPGPGTWIGPAAGSASTDEVEEAGSAA